MRARPWLTSGETSSGPASRASRSAFRSPVLSRVLEDRTTFTPLVFEPAGASVRSIGDEHEALAGLAHEVRQLQRLALEFVRDVAVHGLFAGVLHRDLDRGAHRLIVLVLEGDVRDDGDRAVVLAGLAQRLAEALDDL